MSGVGEMIASSVARRVASKLGDLAVEEATLLWRFKDDVNDMKEKMRDLVAVMQDADDKVRQEEKMEQWHGGGSPKLSPLPTTLRTCWMNSMLLSSSGTINPSSSYTFPGTIRSSRK
uniref:Disease resistance N-terminal domain-containing protein n=1 Tax=Oryza nivara TaxID=4536 RepID=A0A0E0FYI6_ORYNI